MKPVLLPKQHKKIIILWCDEKEIN